MTTLNESRAPAGIRLRDLPALLESLPRLSPEEADAFARDLAEVRAELKGVSWWRTTPCRP
jgi:hypothetical protein